MTNFNESDPSKNSESSNESTPLVDAIDVARCNDMRPREHYWKGPPTDHERKIVYSYACYGACDHDICTVLKFGKNTLYKYFGDELAQGRAAANAKIAQRIYQMAVGTDDVKDDEGNVIQKGKKPSLSALIFLAKVRLGWKETQVVETNETNSNVVIYIPDNGRNKHLEKKQNKEIENE